MAKRNARGAGTIRQRSKNSWEARYTVGRCPETGKQIQETIYGKTQEEVRKKLTAATGEYDRDGFTPELEITVAQWLEEWYTVHLKKQKPRTVENYTSICTNHLIPTLGDMRLSRLTAERIEQFIREQVEAGLSPSTVNLHYTVLKSSLKKAVTKKKLRKGNPCDMVDTDELPTVQEKEIQPLDENAVALFWKATAEHKYKNLYILALYCGARQGELIGITWDDVDFDNGTVHINKQLQRTGTLEPTKRSKKSHHVLSETDMLALKEQKAKQQKWQKNAGSAWRNKLNLCFTDELGSPLKHVSVSREYKKIVTSIGYPESYFHCLRHSFVTYDIAASQNIVATSKRVAHSSVKITERYAHITNLMEHKHAMQFDDKIKDIIKKIS